MTAYYTQLGSLIRLGRKIGQGGEGSVYLIENSNNLAAKIYLPNLAASRHQKIQAMVDAKLAKDTNFVAFPLQALFDSQHKFAGFSMNVVTGHKAIHELYSPSSRKTHFPNANFKFLLRVALNVARAVAAVHSTNCVIGDINHSGVLVSEKTGTVTLIDSDSFQIRQGSSVFTCKVGVPEFTPPELQGIDFSKVLRTTNHDTFGLAVLVFQLLFMGRHPFAGRVANGRDAPELERAIGTFRFAYARSSVTTNMLPPPGVPTLVDIPQDVAAAFESAFLSRGQRPSAATWVQLLQKMEKSITTCRSNISHHYSSTASTCPWCKMESVFPGIFLFGTTSKIYTVAAVDIRGLTGALSAIKDPGVAPQLNTLIASVQNLNVSPKAASIRDNRKRRILQAAALFAAGAILTFTTTGVIQVLGVGSLIGAGIFATRTPFDANTLQTNKIIAEKNWAKISADWNLYSNSDQFRTAKEEATRAINELADISSYKEKLIRELEQKKRANQTRQFLERFRIDSARIPHVGRGRTLQLASYGIETAADISRSRIQAISGFGSTITSELLSWRQTIEQRFVYNAKESIDPKEIADAKTKVAQEQAKRLTKARGEIHRARQASADLLAKRAALRIPAQNAYHALVQAEHDLKVAFAPTILEKNRALVLGVFILAIAITVLGINNFKSSLLSSRSFEPLPKNNAPVVIAPKNVPAPPSPKIESTRPNTQNIVPRMLPNGPPKQPLPPNTKKTEPSEVLIPQLPPPVEILPQVVAPQVISPQIAPEQKLPTKQGAPKSDPWSGFR